MMTGKKLYQLYFDAYVAHDCGVDEWMDLDDRDRCVWEFLAADINTLIIQEGGQ